MNLLSKVCEWIGRKTGTIIMAPHPIVVGNCAEHILFGLLKARREKKKLVLLYQYALPWPLHYRLTNRDLIGVDSECRAFSSGSPLFILGSALITVYAGICRLLQLFLRRLGRPLGDESFYPMVGCFTLWQPEEVMSDFSWEVVAKYDWERELQSRYPVHLSDDRRAAGKRELRHMGLPEGAWFACLHVRESGWHNDGMTERNADIYNYLDAIREVTDRGGWLIRLGDPTMKKLPPMDRVIDYPFTDSKSYAMDLFLISECCVYIGTPSGIYDVAILFQRPIVLTNMQSWLFPMPHKPVDIGTLKHLYSRSRRRFLSVQEWMAEPFGSTSFREMADDYELHENDPAELREAVREFFDRVERTALTPLQQEYNQARIRHGRAILSRPVRPQDGQIKDQRQRYRMASRLESAIGVISDEYLRRNWQDDARNRR